MSGQRVKAPWYSLSGAAEMEKYAQKGDPKAFDFPRSIPQRDDLALASQGSRQVFYIL